MSLVKEPNYRPSQKEPFMNERQREYFRQKLLVWREEILKEAKETLQHLQDENQNHSDLADRASSETDRAIELRARDRQRVRSRRYRSRHKNATSVANAFIATIEASPSRCYLGGRPSRLAISRSRLSNAGRSSSDELLTVGSGATRGSGVTRGSGAMRGSDASRDGTRGTSIVGVTRWVGGAADGVCRGRRGSTLD
jgi:hypothetical protein